MAGRIIKKTRRTSGSPAGCIWIAGRRELLGLAVVDGLVAKVHDQIEHDGADVDKIHDQDIVDGAGNQLGADAAEVAEEDQQDKGQTGAGCGTGFVGLVGIHGPGHTEADQHDGF